MERNPFLQADAKKRAVGGSDEHAAPRGPLSLAEQKAALGRLLERKRKADLAGLLKAQREGHDAKMAYLAADMAKMGITPAAFGEAAAAAAGGGGGGGGGSGGGGGGGATPPPGSARASAINATRKRRSLSHAPHMDAHAVGRAGRAPAGPGKGGAGSALPSWAKAKAPAPAPVNRAAPALSVVGEDAEGGGGLASNPFLRNDAKAAPGGGAARAVKQQATKAAMAARTPTSGRAHAEAHALAANRGAHKDETEHHAVAAAHGGSTTHWRSLKFVPKVAAPEAAPLHACWLLKRGRLAKKLKNRLFKLWPDVAVYYKLEGGAACGVINLRELTGISLSHACGGGGGGGGDAAEGCGAKKAAPASDGGTKKAAAAAAAAAEEEEQNPAFELVMTTSDRTFSLFSSKLAAAEGWLQAVLAATGGRLRLRRLARAFGETAPELRLRLAREKAQAEADAEAARNAEIHHEAQQPSHRRGTSRFGSTLDQTKHREHRVDHLDGDDAHAEEAARTAVAARMGEGAKGGGSGRGGGGARRKSAAAPIFERSLARARSAVRGCSQKFGALQVATESLVLALEGGASDLDDLGADETLAQLAAELTALQTTQLKQLAYAVQLHKTATALHLRHLLSEWNRQGWLRKADWADKKTALVAWEAGRGMGKYSRHWFRLEADSEATIAQNIAEDEACRAAVAAAVAAGDKKARRAAEKAWKARAPLSEVATAAELAAGAPVRWFLRWTAKAPVAGKAPPRDLGQLALADVSIVRATAAPKAPALALDLVTRGGGGGGGGGGGEEGNDLGGGGGGVRVFTIVPEDGEARLRWSMALNEVLAGASGGTGNAALGLTQRLLAQKDEEKVAADKAAFKESLKAPSSMGAAGGAGAQTGFCVCSSHSGAPPPARDAAHEIESALEAGLAVSFEFRAATAETQERYVYKTADAKGMGMLVPPSTATAAAPLQGAGTGSSGGLQLMRVAGGKAGAAAAGAPATLRDEYEAFRRQFTVRSPPEDFRAGLATFMARREQQFLAAMCMLDVAYADEARLVLFRMQVRAQPRARPAAAAAAAAAAALMTTASQSPPLLLLPRTSATAPPHRTRRTSA